MEISQQCEIHIGMPEEHDQSEYNNNPTHENFFISLGNRLDFWIVD